ncbi:glutathione S-transferase family protein [Vibrio quintilis]|uniref:Maleylpyruvate isomerase n=1 Tax=Vibrio quintilis TaxID=1117707 RepID=A0A1M7YQU5_9VIBR|nr:glutathione S-transferase family protein [Vibrio quintilis]SHO54978.1 Maleylpyruvate isomerase [Vibrio quintilis]
MDIVLYTSERANSSHRVEWALNYKKIPYRRIVISPEQPAADYLAINPLGFFPSVSVNGFLISESMAILEYFEERFPDVVPLLGSSANERALVRRICHYVDSMVHSPQNRTALNFFRPELTESERKQLRGEWILNRLNVLSSLMCRESGFATGCKFSLADIFVACIYKKALQHGVAEHEFYHTHLHWLRRNENISLAEPVR